MPQSSSNFLPAASTKYLDPVTVPAAPRKVSFGIRPHCTQCALRFDNRPLLDYCRGGFSPPSIRAARTHLVGDMRFKGLVPHEIQRSLKLHLELRPARQIDFVAAPRFH